MKKLLSLLLLLALLAACVPGTLPSAVPPVMDLPAPPSETVVPETPLPQPTSLPRTEASTPTPPLHTSEPDDLGWVDDPSLYPNTPYTGVVSDSFPEDIERRDGLPVLRPDRLEEFLSPNEVWGEGGEEKEYFGDTNEIFGACGWWCATARYRLIIEATSTLPGKGELSYEPGNVLIDSRYTAWAEGAEGYGIGESIIMQELFDNGYLIEEYMYEGYPERPYGDYSYEEWSAAVLEEAVAMTLPETFSMGTFSFLELCIVTGYAKTEALWEKNSRVKAFKMYVNDEPYAYIALEDTIRPQYFSLYELDFYCGEVITTRFEIVEVYEGPVPDTCVTGILLYPNGLGSH